VGKRVSDMVGKKYEYDQNVEKMDSSDDRHYFAPQGVITRDNSVSTTRKCAS
jgi:hypothetical protein